MKPARRLLWGCAFAAVAASAVLWTCTRTVGDDGTPTESQLAAAGTTPAVPWLDLEQRRDLAAISEALDGDSSAADRVAAARALARIGGAQAAGHLQALLTDPDLEVVRWAAFGLGQDCAAPSAEVEALLTRAASIHALTDPGDEPRVTLRAIAGTLGRCGTDTAEDALRSWLTQPGELAAHGVWGLAQRAARRGYLAEETQVALLTAAGQGQSPLALFPFTRLTRLSAAVQTRLLEVAGQALTTEPGPLRSFAVRALGQAGPAAVEPLSQVLQNGAFSPGERAMAAQALGRLGGPGQKALAAALTALPLPTLDALSDARDDASKLQDGEARRALEAVTVWSAALEAVNTPGPARARLRELAQLELPPKEAPAGRRRAIELRCRAAALVAGPNPGDPLLHACDPDDSNAGALALLRALDRAPLQGQRLATWRKLLDDPRPVIRQGALRLLASHGEVTDSAALLRRAIESDQLGTVVTALQLLAAYPARGSVGADGEEPGVDRALALAVEATLRRKEWRHALEALGSALDAAGALGILSLKGVVEGYCRSPHPELRAHAGRALGLLGDPKRTCGDVIPVPDRMPARARGSVRMELTTDVGPLAVELDGAAAPAAVARLTELARAGYYDGLAIHRVVEGFVVQFGDRPGDGFGDPERPPLPCERSPVPFETLDVGMAVAGRDTATTQWFVTLDRYPQLDGAYTRIGRAEGPWHLLAEGDRVHRVRLAEK